MTAPHVPRILVTHRAFPETIADLQSVGEVIHPGERDAFGRDEVLQHAARADAMLAFMPDMVDEAFLRVAPRLQVIAGALKGCDNFDAEACTHRGVWLTIVPDLLTVPTAELTVGLLIGLARHIRAADAHVRSGRFTGWEPRFYGGGLAESTVGIVGMGAIGRAIAARLKAFGCTLLYTDRQRIAPEQESALAVGATSMERLLAASDFVILAVALTPQTHHLMDGQALSLMRPDAFLVNPCRGSVVDEAAVLEALRAQRLAGYAADVFEMEDWALPERPRTIAAGLLEHPHTLFTPHLGSAVAQVRRRIERRAAESIRQVLAGERPRDAVNEVTRVPC